MLGLQLLEEREHRIQDDHRDDRDRQRRELGQQGEPGGDPQQQRERVRELPAQRGKVPRPVVAANLVRAVLLEPPDRLER